MGVPAAHAKVTELHGEALSAIAHFGLQADALRNLASWEQGLAEMWRVARPGGRLLALDFGKPDLAAWRAVYFAYLRVAVPLLGRCFAGDAQAYAYILESLRHYPAQRGVDARLREMGGRDTRLVNLLGGVMSINYAVKP